MKLYGEELDRELAVRKKAREKRLDNRITLRQASKNNDMGLTPSEYCEWERGSDVCPHEEVEKSIAGFHPPFLLMEVCKKCRHPNILAKIEDEDDWEKNKEALEEAFENCKRNLAERKDL